MASKPHTTTMIGEGRDGMHVDHMCGTSFSLRFVLEMKIKDGVKLAFKVNVYSVNI